MRNYFLRKYGDFLKLAFFMPGSSFLVKMLIALGGCLLICMPLAFSVCLAQDQEISSFDITFEELGHDDRVIEGHEGQIRYYFSLPAGWQPQSNSYLTLNLEYTAILQKEYVPATFDVRLNGEILGTTNFETSTGLQLELDIPPEVLLLAEDRYQNELQLSLDVYVECEQALRVSLSVLNSSSLHFVYEESPLMLDLANYPKPIYQPGSFKPNQARFVLPAEPSETDVAAAVRVAAGLGRLTGNRLALTTSLASDLSSVMNNVEEHLFIIGQPEDNPVIQQLDLPLALAERQLTLHSVLPLMVAPGQIFSYTLSVENTSSESKNLALYDQWDTHIELLNCLGDCEVVAPDALRWTIGTLESGQTISTVVSIQLGQEILLSEEIAHTASLLDENDTVINVDTLSCAVSVTDDGAEQEEAQWVTSNIKKGPYFFVGDTYAVSENDGIIQEVISPQSSRHVIVVVTGLNEDAIFKAGQALGDNSQFPGMSGTCTIVRAVQPSSEPVMPVAEEMTLASLGYTDRSLAAYGSTEFVFEMPRAWTPTRNAGLMLHYAYGSALNEVSGTLEIELNGVPIHSILLDQRDTQNVLETISFPVTRLRADLNYIRLHLVGSFPVCMSDEFASRFWATIYADSLIRLPHTLDTVDREFDLGTFPQPFSKRNDLGDVIFSLPETPSIVNLEGALQLASLLGSRSDGGSFSLQVVLGGNPQDDQWSEYHLIALGRPTTNPYIAAFNDLLPQPFIPGTDVIQQQIDNVIYRLPPNYSLGYLQMLASPWDVEHAFLVVTGSTDEGVAWAWDALIDSGRRYQLAGNLAILLQEKTMRTRDTRERTVGGDTTIFSPSVTSVLTTEVTITPTPHLTASPTVLFTPIPTSTPVVEPDATPIAVHQRPVWLLPLLIVSIITIIIGVILWKVKT